ncbi:C-type mannose receptor 2-like [Haliotis cracherodii]|uniref:C-type mannose receptor 2-like n=1 Tax=Haliotis cracherodii TaxID=6455 RepID=UPI0039EA431C
MNKPVVWRCVWMPLLLAGLTASQGQNNMGTVRCLECPQAKSPTDCDNWAQCGRGEICYTREYIDHNEDRAYNMGCEDKTRCELFINAKILIGKRETDNLELTNENDLDPLPPEKCYQCCPQNDCNARLCAGFTGGLTPTITYESHSSCPPTFVTGPTSCYYVANWTMTWETARLDCARRGSDLVAIHSRQEMTFLANLLNATEATYHPTQGYWTGGVYVTATKSWIWVDMTKASFTHWGPGQPSTSDYNQRVVLHNPIKYPTFVGWQWSISAHTTGMGFICERDFV